MITLPSPADDSCLRSFSSAMVFLAGLTLTILHGFVLDSGIPGLVWGVVLVTPLIGLLWPRAAVLPYRVWNKAGHKLAQCASRFLLMICFYVIFVAVGKSGSKLALLPTMQSLWLPRGSLPAAAYQTRDRGWILDYLSWSIASNNYWACCFLPFLIFLALLDTGQRESFPSGIYTLF